MIYIIMYYIKDNIIPPNIGCAIDIIFSSPPSRCIKMILGKGENTLGETILFALKRRE